MKREAVLLIVFMAKGIYPRGAHHTVHLFQVLDVERVARLFRPHLVNGAVRFMDESHPDVPGAIIVVDCMVCQLRHPKLPLHDAKLFQR